MASDKPHRQAVKPAAFQPPQPGAGRQQRRIHPLNAALGVAGLALIVVMWFVFTAKPVTLNFSPPAESVSVAGGISFEIGGNRLMRHGNYTINALLTGYHPLAEPIEVSKGGDNKFNFEFRKLPGRLTVTTTPALAQLAIDGELIGDTPLTDVLVEPGERTVTISAKRYRSHEQLLTIEGMDIQQQLDIALIPAWADVSVNSVPAGATLYVDGEAVGVTPLTTEVGEGAATLTLRLKGYRDWQRDITVVANKAMTLPTAELQRAPGLMAVSSEPEGAAVSVNGEYRGRTPVTVEVTADQPSEIKVSSPGYRSESQKVTLAAEAQQSLNFSLNAITGVIKVRSTPEDALLYVNGQAKGPANQNLTLVAKPQTIEVRKDGYASFSKTVTPKPGFAQVVNVRLLTKREAYLAQFDEEIETGGGQRMRLIRVGPTFTMGSPRREQGRNANETEHDVRLTRMFYMARHEVTNQQFRQFRPQHSSGIVERKTLDNDNMPVARVSWDDAVAYCNWLSAKDGLPPAYSGGELITPVNKGYRLPTEAEWAWVARFAGGSPQKYPWGDNMPPTGKAGNYADTSSVGLGTAPLNNYYDGFPAAAPVGRFDPNALGIYDLGGNVREWVNDHLVATTNLTGTEVDPLGIGSGSTHVTRGSSWRHGRITELRLSYRDAAASAQDDLGFRIVRYAE